VPENSEDYCTMPSPSILFFMGILVSFPYCGAHLNPSVTRGSVRSFTSMDFIQESFFDN
jgi:hypothetical protein